MKELTAKSPWEKPGGTLAKVMLVVLIVALCVGLYYALPYLIELTKNMLTLAALVGVLALIVFMIMNDSSRNFFKNLYFVIMRKLTGLIVEIDPIAIVKGKIKDMKNRLVKIEDGISKMRGVHVKNEKALEANKKDLQDSLKMFMADSEAILDETGNVLLTWKSGKDRTSFDSKTFAAENPDLYAKYCKTVPGARSFLLKKIKEQ